MLITHVLPDRNIVNKVIMNVIGFAIGVATLFVAGVMMAIHYVCHTPPQLQLTSVADIERIGDVGWCRENSSREHLVCVLHCASPSQV